MSARRRRRPGLAAAMAGAVAAWAVAGAPTHAQGSAAGAPIGPRIALVTAWGPTFWRALRNGSPMAFTPQGDAFVVAPGLGSDLQVIEELAPDGSLLWQTAAYQEIHSLVSFDGGARVAFLALPDPSSRPYHLVLGILDPATGALTQTPIDYRAGAGLVSAGRDVLVLGDWPVHGFAAVFNAGGSLVSSLAPPGVEPAFTTATGAEILAFNGYTATVWTVSGSTGRITRAGTMPATPGYGWNVSPLAGGAFLQFIQQPNANGYTVAAWAPAPKGGLHEAWAWPASRLVDANFGYGVEDPAAALAALPVAGGIDVVRTTTGAVAAQVQAKGYQMRAVAAQPEGFVALEMPSDAFVRIVRPDRLATFSWQGRALETVTLPATQNPLNEPFYAQTASVDGLVLTATSLADDVAAVGAPAVGQPLPASVPATLEAAPLSLGSVAPAVASLEVVANGQAVDAGHPLVVTAADAGRPCPVAVLAVDSAGDNVPAPSAEPFTLSDGGMGGTFLPAPDWGIPTGALGASLTYENAKPGSYVLTATPSNPLAQRPLFTLPKAVDAGAPVQVVLEPRAIRPGEGVEIVPVSGSDLASDAPVTATPEANGTYVATFVAGKRTGAAAFEAVLPSRNIDLGQSPLLNVARLAAPARTMQYSAAGLRLTLSPQAPGDTPIGFLVAPSSGGPPIVAAYLGLPAVVVLAGHAPLSATVSAVDADGAQTAPLGGGVG